MPLSKVKNAIILILVLVNVLLLLLAVPLVRERQAQQALSAAQLETLFTQYDVQLDSALLPESIPLYTVEFTPESENSLPAMQALLGENVLVQDDSTRYLTLYESDAGTAQMSRSGNLEAQLFSRSAQSDISQTVRDELSAMGIAYTELSSPVRTSAGGYTLSAAQELLGVPVFSAHLHFSFRNGALTRVYGTIYPDTASLVRIDDSLSISCADALVAFLGSRDELGWLGSSVRDVTQGYLRAETASATSVRLVPGWRITTDTGIFWVNGITREVSSLDY